MLFLVRMKVLDLFSGIGGFSLGLERAGMETIAFCEIDPFCRKVLRKHWPDVPVFDDVRTLNPDELPAQPDLVCGGYPCQPFSVAGRQRGKEDDRHLWPQMLRVIQACRPAWVLAENVAGHIRLGLDEVLFDLEGAGYEAQPFVIPACAVDAPHRRDRVWIVGYAEHDGSFAASLATEPDEDGQRSQEGPAQAVESEGAGGRADHEAVADTKGQRIQGHGAGGQQEPSAHGGQKLSLCAGEGSWETWWQAEPRVDRVVDGVPNRVDRVKALGNAVVPQIPELIGRAILACETD